MIVICKFEGWFTITRMYTDVRFATHAVSQQTQHFCCRKEQQKVTAPRGGVKKNNSKWNRTGSKLNYFYLLKSLCACLYSSSIEVIYITITRLLNCSSHSYPGKFSGQYLQLPILIITLDDISTFSELYLYRNERHLNRNVTIQWGNWKHLSNFPRYVRGQNL